MDKMFYKIGQFSKMAGVDAGTLRYWEKEFDQLRPAKNRAGQRIYNQRDLELVVTIKRLLYEQGYTVAGAKRQLKAVVQAGKESAADRGDSPNQSELISRVEGAKKLAGEILEILDRSRRKSDGRRTNSEQKRT